MSEKHEKFVRLSRRALLNNLVESEPYKVGSWFKGLSRPDLFIIQHPSRESSPHDKDKILLVDWKDNAFVVECKVEMQDVRRGLFQLVLALASLPRHADIDFAHGGLRLVLAISEALHRKLMSMEAYEDLRTLYGSLHFGLAIIDEETERVTWDLWSASFM